MPQQAWVANPWLFAAMSALPSTYTELPVYRPFLTVFSGNATSPGVDSGSDKSLAEIDCDYPVTRIQIDEHLCPLENDTIRRDSLVTV